MWFESNNVTLDVNKTQIIMSSCKKILTLQNEVILGKEVVQWVNKANFFGVIVDQYLNWKDHMPMISQKNSNSCGIIYRIRNTLDIKYKRLIYYSLIHPYLTCVLCERQSEAVSLESFVSQTTYRWSDFTLSINREARNCWTWIKPAIAGSSFYGIGEYLMR